MQKFIIYFAGKTREEFNVLAGLAVIGTKDNPDFKDAPVTNATFKAQYDEMMLAYPAVSRSNKPANDIYDALRVKVEKSMRSLAMYAQPRIGDNLERMKASGLPLTKEAAPREKKLTKIVGGSVKPGDVAGSIWAHAKKIDAANGLVLEMKDADGQFKERAKISKMTITLEGLESGKEYEVRLRYWNDAGVGGASDVFYVRPD